jgi:hypothetical protein
VGAPRPQGWFLDPFGAHEARYFSDGSPTRLVRDGETESYDEPPVGAAAIGSEHLTEVPSPPEPYGGPVVWPLGGSGRAIMALTGVAAAVALVVVVVSAISERPIPQLRLAVVPAVAVLVVGQLWTFAVMIRRGPGRSIGLSETKQLFSPLPRRIYLGIFALFVVGWLSALTATLALTNGTPSGGGPAACPYPAYYHGSMVCISGAAWLRALEEEGRGVEGASHVTVNSVPPGTRIPACPYSFDNQGSTTCTSKAAWQRAVAAEERAGAGVMLGLFVAYFGVAWSEVLRNRQERARAGSG